jgi:hypothetical protein
MNPTQDVFKKWHYHENPCTRLLTKVARVMKVFGRTSKRSFGSSYKNLNFCFQNYLMKYSAFSFRMFKVELGHYWWCHTIETLNKHGGYKWFIMHEKCGRPDSNGFQLKWRFGTHGNWKNQNPGGRFGATS